MDILPPDKRKRPAHHSRPSPNPSRGQIDRQAIRDIFPQHPGKRPLKRLHKE